jgi:hypothetical protein
MKNLIKQSVLACTLIIFSTTISFAQFQFGATAGITSSTQSKLGNIWNNDNICCNFTGGLQARYHINDWLSVKSAALYTSKGSTQDLTILNTSVSPEFKFSYIEIPVKAVFSTTLQKNSDQKIFAGVGPYLSFLIDSEMTLNDKTTNVDDQVNSTDFGLAMEIGYELPISNHALQFSINYDMGLTEISDIDTDLRNKALSFNVGFYF